MSGITALTGRHADAAIVSAAEKLVEAIAHDDNRSGGLLSRETIRKSDELRVALLHWRRRVRG